MVMTHRVTRFLENEKDPLYPYPVVFGNMEVSEAEILRAWLRQHGGRENEDWAWTHGWWGDTVHCFRFRDPCTAEFFRLTWHPTSV